MRRSLALSLIVLCLSAANAFAGAEARMSGKVIDAVTKEPIKDVTFQYDATEMKKISKTEKGRADGSFAIFVLDGTIKYKFTVSAPGYIPYEEVIKLKIGGTTERNFELLKVGTVVQGAPGAATKEIVDEAAVAYNEGADLANAGKFTEAMVKFQESVKIKPEMTAGWIAIAKTAYKMKDYTLAIEAATKATEFDEDQPDMQTILYEAYTAKGDKAAAAKAQAKMPKNAGALFNEAARLINAGDDKGAEVALKQAVAADETFSQAYYELGMIYVRGGKNADAKAALTKYLELAPDGKDAATAKEMLNYVK
jgi:tetratricopeptide (TPR) repeat protein